MPSERAVTLYMNDVEVATVQATPSHLEEMAVGFLLAEGLLSERFLSSVAEEKAEGEVFMHMCKEI
jgi:FdhD protein